MLKLIDGLKALPQNSKALYQSAKNYGLKDLLKLLWDDLFAGRSLAGWLYLIALSAVPFILEFSGPAKDHDWMGILASWTGIVCVILVAEGRASNYLFGAINSAIYLVLALDATFYGEVVTTLYFFIMQPIGLYIWLVDRLAQKTTDQQASQFEARKLDLKGWIKYLALTLAIWFLMGLAYTSIKSDRPFRDSITDGTNGVGQMLMNNLYREQWIFWIATNLFSIYLWWGSNSQIQGMYWVYTLNSVVGWYQWSKAVKETKARNT